MTRWTHEGCIEAVRAFHARHGYQPISDEAGTTNGLPSFGTAVRIFNSWNAMIEASGFRAYPARSSSQAKSLAFRDRNPDWREQRFAGVQIRKPSAVPLEAVSPTRRTES